MGVAQAGDRPGLALEAGESFGVPRHVLGEDLDCDVATEAGVAGAVDLTHSPGPDRGQDLVRAETAARREHHRANLGVILCATVPGVQRFPTAPFYFFRLALRGLERRSPAPGCPSAERGTTLIRSSSS